ncbi:MAG: hypothetical protein GXO78_07150 [Calditrichaeota bacterium]|nr:hypothetical protein [Calditrichota bacterium]
MGNWRLLLVALAGLVFFMRCSENPVNLGEKVLPDPELSGKLLKDTLYANVLTSVKKPENLKTNNTSRLLIGKFQGLQFRPIIKFTKPVAFPNKVYVHKATVALIVRAVQGDTLIPYQISAFRITEEWEDNTDDIWTDYRTSIDAAVPLGTVTLEGRAQDTLYLSLEDTALVATWTDTGSAIPNYGFLLDFDDSHPDFIIEFQAHPKLIIEYEVELNTIVRKDSSFAVTDAFLIDGDFNSLDTTRYHYVSTLRPRNIVLGFDFQRFVDRFPDGVLVTSVNLHLPFVKEKSWIHPEYGANLYLRALTQPLTSGELSYDTTLAPIGFDRLNLDSTYLQIAAGTERRNFAIQYLQRWFKEDRPYEGFLIEFRNDTDYFSYFAVPELDQAVPYLIIYYWIPPGTRF